MSEPGDDPRAREETEPFGYFVYLDLTRRFVQAHVTSQKERAESILAAIAVLEREYPETKAVVDRRFPIENSPTKGEPRP